MTKYIFYFFFKKNNLEFPPNKPIPSVPILKTGVAERVVFFYPTEEGTYLENVNVTLYTNGIVMITTEEEAISTHLQNCEILWKTSPSDQKIQNNLHLIKK